MEKSEELSNSNFRKDDGYTPYGAIAQWYAYRFTKRL